MVWVCVSVCSVSVEGGKPPPAGASQCPEPMSWDTQLKEKGRERGILAPCWQVREAQGKPKQDIPAGRTQHVCGRQAKKGGPLWGPLRSPPPLCHSSGGRAIKWSAYPYSHEDNQVLATKGLPATDGASAFSLMGTPVLQAPAFRTRQKRELRRREGHPTALMRASC